jgi:hypothetical protein
VFVRVGAAKSNDRTKYVELAVDYLRTRVRFPPAPPSYIPRSTEKVLKPVTAKASRVFLLPCWSILFRAIPGVLGATTGDREWRYPHSVKSILERLAMPLTDIEVKKSGPCDITYRVRDGDGMFLEIRPNGSKYWRLKYRFGGKEKLLALGTHPAVTLKEARGKHCLNG